MTSRFKIYWEDEMKTLNFKGGKFLLEEQQFTPSRMM